MGHFGLELQEDKSKLIKFGRFAQHDAKEKGRKAGVPDKMGRQAFLGTGILCFNSRECKRRNDSEIFLTLSRVSDRINLSARLRVSENLNFYGEVYCVIIGSLSRSLVET